MNVTDWLNRVRMLDELINAKLAERDQWIGLGARLTSESDGMPHAKGGVSDPVGNAGAKLADLAKETGRLIDEYVDHKQKVIATIEQLPAKQYAVIHKMYIQYKTQEKIAEELNCCTMTVWRIQKKALENLQNVIECDVPREYNVSVK